MKFLILGNQLLYPAQTGGMIRSSSLFERLKREHEITLLVFRRPDETDEQVELMGRCCQRLETVPWRETAKRSPAFYAELLANLASPLPYIVWKYRSPALAGRLRELLDELRPDILLCDFLQPSVNAIDLPFRPKLLFQHNVEAQIRRRHAEQAGHPLARWYWGLQYRRLAAYEQRAGQAFDHCLMVSEQDAALMASEYGVASTSVVPLGVDVDYFAPDATPAVPGRLVFTGSMDWLPNEDAVAWYCAEMAPLLARTHPGASLSIVGRRPSAKVQALAGERVMVTGTVPDIRPSLREAEVYIVPLRIGGGTRIKIFEAMAAGRAIVSTSLGAEGLPVEDGVDILLADTAEAFVAAIARLLDDPALRARLGAAARAKMVARYSWEQAARIFAEQCAAAAERVRTGS